MTLPPARPRRLLDLREPARAARITLDDPGELRTSAVATWRGRMVNEHESALVFEGLSIQLAAAGLPDCGHFADEERRHGVLCGAVVESLGGEARAWVEAYPAYPEHADAEPLEAALRNVLAVCCLSETVAVALIGAERLEMPKGPLHELLSSIYADEVGHSNFGWRLLHRVAPDLPQPLRERLGAYLRVAFRHLEVHELGHLPLDATPPEEGAAFGLCSGADARVLFYETVEQIIVPGLERLGVPADAAWNERAPERAGAT
jgi:hypothetical protein